MFCLERFVGVNCLNSFEKSSQKTVCSQNNLTTNCNSCCTSPSRVCGTASAPSRCKLRAWTVAPVSVARCPRPPAQASDCITSRPPIPDSAFSCHAQSGTGQRLCAAAINHHRGGRRAGVTWRTSLSFHLHKWRSLTSRLSTDGAS